MIVERNREGGWAIYAINNGQLIQRQYYFYTKRQAIRHFNNELKQLNKGNK